MRARWRIENLFKYLDFYGIDYLADYTATIETNTRKVDNPQRKALRRQLADLVEQRDQLRHRIGALHTDRAITLAALNRESTTAQRKIHTLEKKIAAVEDTLKTVPAKLPANVINPDAKGAIHRAQRRTLQTCYACWPPTPSTGSPTTSTPTCKTTTSTAPRPATCCISAASSPTPPTTIHIELNKPNPPRLTRALALLLDEINHAPPHIPGDPRPITYALKP